MQYLWVVIDSTSFRASPSVERISRLRSSRRISVMRLAYREPVAVASRRSFLDGSPRSWRLTEDAVPAALPPSFLVPSGSGGSSVSVDDVSSRSGAGSIYLVCLSGCLSARCLLTYTFGPTPRKWVGAPISTVRSLPACGTPNRQRCLSTPGNCSLFSWGFSSSGQLSEVVQWLSFASTPQGEWVPLVLAGTLTRPSNGRSFRPP